MSGSHYAPEPSENRGPLTVDDLLATVRDVPGTQYDLRTVTEREADELAALRLEVAALTDALNYANGRADALERRVKALEEAASRHADALTVIQLRKGL